MTRDQFKALLWLWGREFGGRVNQSDEIETFNVSLTCVLQNAIEVGPGYVDPGKKRKPVYIKDEKGRWRIDLELSASHRCAGKETRSARADTWEPHRDADWVDKTCSALYLHNRPQGVIVRVQHCIRGDQWADKWPAAKKVLQLPRLKWETYLQELRDGREWMFLAMSAAEAARELSDRQWQNSMQSAVTNT